MKEVKRKSYAKIEAEKAERREFAELVEDIKAFGVETQEGAHEDPQAEEAPKLPASANVNLVFARLFGGAQ